MPEDVEVFKKLAEAEATPDFSVPFDYFAILRFALHFGANLFPLVNGVVLMSMGYPSLKHLVIKDFSTSRNFYPAKTDSRQSVSAGEFCTVYERLLYVYIPSLHLHTNRI